MHMAPVQFFHFGANMRLNLVILCGFLILAKIGAPDTLVFGQTNTFAPGVIKIVPSDPQARDTFTLPMKLPGLQSEKWDPNFASQKHTLFGQTQNIIMFRDVWQYEFAMLGLRQMKVRVTSKDGKKRTKNVWYLVYRIRNMGNGLTYVTKRDGTGPQDVRYELVKDSKIQPEKGDFIPRFTLEGWVTEKGTYRKMSFEDQIRPKLLRLIQNREDPSLMLLDTFGMNSATVPMAKTPLDEGVWGVAIWENVDPRIDYASVKVSGITNAYRIVNKPDGSMAIKRRILQLNFWRPGDTVDESNDILPYGVPLVDDPKEQIEICRKYNLAGPMIQGFYRNATAQQDVLIVEMDAQIDLKTLKSPIVPQLDAGQLPKVLADRFARAGFDVPEGTTVKQVIERKKWSFQLGADEFTLVLEPQYWEPKQNGGIRFIKSLDYMWIYR